MSQFHLIYQSRDQEKDKLHNMFIWHGIGDCSLLLGDPVSDIVLCAQHVITDGFSMAIVTLRINPSHSFWSTARKYQHKLRIQLKPKKIFGLFRLFSKCVPIAQIQSLGPLFVELRSNQAAFGITNLGSLDKLGLDTQDSSFQIESLTAGVSGTFDAIVIMVFTLRQQLHSGLRYFASNFSEEEMQRMIAEAMNRFYRAIT